ncbi:malic enzyme, NAD binding domain-containing protein, partial [Pavlovales sp. CCMP2436]
AADILALYRHDYLCFNDDVQGTGAVVLTGILGSLRQRGKGPEGLLEERIVMCGAGSADMGILKQLLDAMEVHGVSREKAAESLSLMDHTGCVGQSKEGDEPTKSEVALSKTHLDGTKLPALIDAVKPTMLIGCTGKGGLFTEERFVSGFLIIHHFYQLPTSA